MIHLNPLAGSSYRVISIVSNQRWQKWKKTRVFVGINEQSDEAGYDRSKLETG